MVARLGEANWQRHHHVRNIPLSDGDLLNNEFDTVENATAFFRPYSAFRNSGIGTSIPAQTEYAASHTSFLSTKSEMKLDGLKVPPCPERMIESKSFQCFLCGRTQSNIRNHVDWKSVSLKYPLSYLLTIIRMHVFADLKPYICTFSNCNMELAQFPSRAAWAEHEFTQHRITCSSRCAECFNTFSTPALYSKHLQKVHQRDFSDIGLQTAVDMALSRQVHSAEKGECPLYRVVPGCSKRAFIKHVGRHMEQIALMALPREIEESEADKSDVKGGVKQGDVSNTSRDSNRASELERTRSENANYPPKDPVSHKFHTPKYRSTPFPCQFHRMEAHT